MVMEIGVFFAALVGGIFGGAIAWGIFSRVEHPSKPDRSDFENRLARIRGMYLGNFSRDQCFELARQLWPHGSDAEILLLTNTLASRACRGNGSMEDVHRAWRNLPRVYPKA